MLEKNDLDNQLSFRTQRLFKSLYFFFIIVMMIIGYATTEILSFAIEEAFMQPVVYSLFNIWGPEFAKSAAWLILSSIVMIPLAVIQKRISMKNKEFYTLSFRHKLINMAILIGLVTSFVYILMMTYSYFSGRSDPVGMYRVVSTIIMILLGLAVLWFEKYLSPKLHLTVYLSIFLIPMISCVALGTTLTLRYASPAKMRQVNEDLNKIEALENLALLIKNYFIIHGKLPKDKNSVLQEGKSTLLEEFYDVIHYAIVDDTTFKLCTHFDTNYSDARRITRLRNRFYKMGKHCLVFSLAKHKGNTSITVSHNHNIQIVLP